SGSRRLGRESPEFPTDGPPGSVPSAAYDSIGRRLRPSSVRTELLPDMTWAYALRSGPQAFARRAFGVDRANGVAGSRVASQAGDAAVSLRTPVAVHAPRLCLDVPR